MREGRGGWSGIGLALLLVACGRNQIFELTSDAGESPPPADCTLTLSPETLYFGWLPVGQLAVQRATLTNVGSQACAVTGLALDPSSDPSFAFDVTQATTLSIPVGQSATVTVDFILDNDNPPNERTGTVVFQSNDPKQPTGEIPLLASLETVGTVCPSDHPNLFTGQTDQGGVCQDGTTCATGLTCNGSACWLLGENSPLQIVLSWDFAEDLDLHLVEPQAGGPDSEFTPDAGVVSGCEIYYGNGVEGSPDADCFPVGTLNRDAQAACVTEDLNVEEVTYPVGAPPPAGWYTVRVDFWQDCDDVTAQSHPTIPYVVQVRIGGTLQSFCGQFTPDQADEGSEGSGATVLQFQIPVDAGF